MYGFIVPFVASRIGLGPLLNGGSPLLRHRVVTRSRRKVSDRQKGDATWPSSGGTEWSMGVESGQVRHVMVRPVLLFVV